MEKQYYMYILTNYAHSVLYVGVTNNLCKRVWEHRQENALGFTKTYHVHELVYFESYADPVSAIEREKQIKQWSRKKKDTLILKMNPAKVDLYAQLCG